MDEKKMNEAVRQVLKRLHVDRAGHTIDFLLRAHRIFAAARRFFERAIERHGVPEKITIDKSRVNTAAIVGMCTDSGVDIEMRPSKYLNGLIEQDIAPSNAACERCSDSSRFVVRAPSSQASKPCP